MTALFMLATLVAYFSLLLFISRRAARGGRGGNDAFFRAGRQSPWWMVAFGMVGASISGVTFISVPGWAASTGMTYLQMCMGFVVGYVAVAFVLLPLYYRLRLTSIYAYLGERFGPRTHRTGALFFVLSKLMGAAARMYLVCMVLAQFVIVPYLGSGLLPFLLVVAAVLLLIWLYPRQAGMQAIVRTDALQTLCLLLAAGGMAVAAAQTLDMMQKNLTCRSLREAQKDMVSYGLAFLPVNALFLGLGILLFSLCAAQGLTPPAAGDSLLPWLVSEGVLGAWVVVPFTLGIVAAAFSSADSALTALTTTVCIDLLRVEQRALPAAEAQAVRRRVHGAVVLAFSLCMVLFKLAEGGNMIDVIYVLASYTYGPLLGLYAFGLFSRQQVRDRAVPFVCLAAPLLCGLLDHFAPVWWGYTFGYELLLLNGLLTLLGLYALRKR